MASPLDNKKTAEQLAIDNNIERGRDKIKLIKTGHGNYRWSWTNGAEQRDPMYQHQVVIDPFGEHSEIDMSNPETWPFNQSSEVVEMDTTTGVIVPANYQFTRGDVDPNFDLPDEVAEEIVSNLNRTLKNRLRSEYGVALSGAPGHSVAVREIGDDDAPSRVPPVEEVIPPAENLQIQREIAKRHGIDGVA